MSEPVNNNQRHIHIPLHVTQSETADENIRTWRKYTKLYDTQAIRSI